AEFVVADLDRAEGRRRLLVLERGDLLLSEIHQRLRFGRVMAVAVDDHGFLTPRLWPLFSFDCGSHPTARRESLPSAHPCKPPPNPRVSPWHPPSKARHRLRRRSSLLRASLRHAACRARASA